MKKKAMAAVSTAVCASMLLSACGSSASTSTTAASAETTAAEAKAEGTTAASEPAAPGDVVTINIGFENTTEEPIGQAVEKWAELLKEESNGTMELKVFANSALGNKSKRSTRWLWARMLSRLQMARTMQITVYRILEFSMDHSSLTIGMRFGN